MFDLRWAMKLDTSMSFRATVLKRSFALLLFALLALPQARAAGPTSPIVFNDRDGLTVTLVASPNIGSSSESSQVGNAGQWLKVEFHYSVTPQTATPFVDAAEFKVWIEGRDLYAANAPGDAGVAVVLTGTVTYVNIPAGRDAYGVFYVHPSTLARYSSKEGVEDFDRKFNVHIEADVAGVESDYFDKMKDPQGPDWYKGPKPVANLVYRKDQSPFVMGDVDHYPAIKLPAPAQ